MPFLNLLDKLKEFSDAKVPEIANLPYTPDVIGGQLTFEEYLFPKAGLSTSTSKNSKNKNNKREGTKYELYVGALYESKGYNVEYNGINKGRHDLARDLICKKDTYTVIVQCKYYVISQFISVNEIYKFYGSIRHYAVENPQEIVHGAFWTALDIRKKCMEAFRAAVALGIAVYDGVFILE